MNITRFALLLCLAATLGWTGCEAFANHTNPVAGWKSLEWTSPNKTITADSQAFIKTLPAREAKFVTETDITFSEDGTGQHAATIAIPLNGTWWNYVLIYDKSNARTKVVKFISGHYSC